MDDRDDFETEGEPPTEQAAERVRIIGAQPASAAASHDEPETEVAVDATEGATATAPELDDDAPERVTAPGAPEMPHWSEPPTGQVPAVLDRRGDEDAENGGWSASGDTGPAWREHAHEWDDSTFEPALLADDQTRVGAIEEAPIEERRPWEFDDLRAPAPVARDAEAQGRQNAEGSTGPGAGRPGLRRPGVENGAIAREAGAAHNGEDAPSRGWWDEDDTPAKGASGPAEAVPSARAESRPEPSVTAATGGVASISSSPLRVGRRAAPTGPFTPGPTGRPERLGGGGHDDGEPRSMPVAIATGLGFALVAVLCFKAGSVATLVLAAVVVTLAAAECYAALRRSGRHPATFLGLVGTVAVMVAAYAKGTAAVPLVLVLVVVTSMLWYLVGADRGSPVEGIASTVLGFAWVGILGSFAALMLAPSQYPQRHGVAFVLGAVVATIGADVGALAVGSWIGRHPLAPQVSPNKTWEGLVGGAVLAVALSAGVTGMVHPWTPGKAAVLGIVAAVVAPLGDLAESMVKRDLGLKDMGSMLPGHGGVLDRVDAVLFVLPATYYLVRVLNLG